MEHDRERYWPYHITRVEAWVSATGEIFVFGMEYDDVVVIRSTKGRADLERIQNAAYTNTLNECIRDWVYTANAEDVFFRSGNVLRGQAFAHRAEFRPSHQIVIAKPYVFLTWVVARWTEGVAHFFGIPQES